MGTAFRLRHEYVLCKECKREFSRTVRNGVAPKKICTNCYERLRYRGKKK
jgi:hypothetical protein